MPIRIHTNSLTLTSCARYNLKRNWKTETLYKDLPLSLSTFCDEWEYIEKYGWDEDEQDESWDPCYYGDIWTPDNWTIILVEEELLETLAQDEIEWDLKYSFAEDGFAFGYDEGLWDVGKAEDYNLWGLVTDYVTHLRSHKQYLADRLLVISKSKAPQERLDKGLLTAGRPLSRLFGLLRVDSYQHICHQDNDDKTDKETRAVIRHRNKCQVELSVRDIRCTCSHGIYHNVSIHLNLDHMTWVLEYDKSCQNDPCYTLKGDMFKLPISLLTRFGLFTGYTGEEDWEPLWTSLVRTTFTTLLQLPAEPQNKCWEACAYLMEIGKKPEERECYYVNKKMQRQRYSEPEEDERWR